MTKFITLLVGIFLMLSSGFVRADPPVTQYGYGSAYCVPAGSWYSSKEAASSAFIQCANTGSNTYNGSGKYNVVFREWYSGLMFVYDLKCKVAAGCADSWTYGAAMESRTWCASGVQPDNSKPLADRCPARCAKDVENVVRVNYGVNFTRPFVASDVPSVYQGCVVTVPEFLRCMTTVSTGNLYCVFRVKNTGAASDVTPQNPPVSDSGAGPAGTETPANLGPVKAPNAVDCPKGTVQAGMSSDGVPLCVGTGTSPSTSTAANTKTSPETTTTAADGSSVKTQVTETTNADGSTTTTTKTTTTKADGTVVVSVGSTTGKTPSGVDGKPGTNGVDGKDAKGICETNPELTVCRNSTVSGDCDAGITYVGDAIQGATLQAAKAIQCKQLKDEAELKASPLHQLGTAVVGGNDPDASKLPSVANAATVQMPTSLNTTGFGVGGSPFSDVSFTLQGKSFTVPLAKWSGYLEPLRYVMMIIAALVSFRMLSGSILRD